MELLAELWKANIRAEADYSNDFEQNPNASIKEAESMLMVNGFAVHKTLIQKMKKNAGERKSTTVTAKKNQPAGILTEKIREIVREEIAETIKSELAKLLS